MTDLFFIAYVIRIHCQIYMDFWAFVVIDFHGVGQGDNLVKFGVDLRLLVKRCLWFSLLYGGF